jgi:hypothetical protein
MANRISFDDKVQAQASNLPANKKLTHTDVNEIKTIVNSHADDLESPALNNDPTEDSALNPVTPTDGINHMYITTTGGTDIRSINAVGDYLYVTNVSGVNDQLVAFSGQSFIGIGGTVTTNPIPNNSVWLLKAVSLTQWVLIDLGTLVSLA